MLKHSRLPEQQLWAMPIVMDTNDESTQVGDRVALTWRGATVAVVEVTSVWLPDKAAEAKAVFGTTSLEHPGVMELATGRGRVYYGGAIHGLQAPARDMECASPADVRSQLPAPSADAPVVAFQCRNPLHRAHVALVLRALDELPRATVLVHPTVGPTQPGDIDAVTRVATYRALQEELKNPRVKWAFLPFNMRMAGPREALQHMVRCGQDGVRKAGEGVSGEALVG